MTVLRGLGVSAGVAAGPVVRLAARAGPPPGGPRPLDREVEAARIPPAMERAARELAARAAAEVGEARAVLEATAALARDPGLAALAGRAVREDGVTATAAVWAAAGFFRDTLAAGDGYVAGRSEDVEAIRDRIVAELSDGRPVGVPDPGHPFVLVADDLAPADTATLAPDRVLAFVTARGGPTSHTAIVARARGIPAVVACPDAIGLTDGAPVVVDGTAGTVTVRDSSADRRRPASAGPAEVPAPPEPWQGPGRTADGRRVALLANVGSPAEARAAAAAGAEGIGLLRTEFLFPGRAGEPSPAEQSRVYAEVLAAFPGGRVVVRPFDAGADKPLSFLDPGAEPNPALGVRGVRIALARPAVLERQLAAIAAAAAGASAEVWVMAPMVAVPDEAERFAQAARSAGLPTVGVMVEVPAAALGVREVLRSVDFVSVGTNDLAQYTMAADRTSGALAALQDPWQPAVLRLVAMVGEGGAAAGKPVGICGEAAADPPLAAVLVGMGATSLSMAHSALVPVGRLLGSLSAADCTELARVALAAPDAATARTAVHHHLTTRRRP
jgi:phosphotransferase system enzyme I (PtsI)